VLKSLKQILEEIRKNEGYDYLTDEQLIYFAAYNLYLDIKIMNKTTKTWDQFRLDLEENNYVKL
jgi:hypothetical protein